MTRPDLNRRRAVRLVEVPTGRPLCADLTVPDRGRALIVGMAILDAHGHWEKVNNRAGGADLWGEQHLILLGQAALLAADGDPQ